MMSTLTYDTTKDHTFEETKASIVDLFHAFCSHEFGNDKWEEFMSHKEFNLMMAKYQSKYGDIIFSVLADTVSEIQNIQILDLLHNFSTFIRSYY